MVPVRISNELKSSPSEVDVESNLGNPTGSKTENVLTSLVHFLQGVWQRILSLISFARVRHARDGIPLAEFPNDLSAITHKAPASRATEYNAAFSPLKVEAQSFSRRPVFLRRPSLEYQHAFDLCAEAVHMRSLAPVIIATSPFYVRELTKRFRDCQTKLILPSLSDWGAGGMGWELDASRENLKYWLESEMDLPVSEETLLSIDALDVKTRAVVWAEPEPRYQAQVLSAVQRILLPGGRLYVITSNGLAGILPEWQQSDSNLRLNLRALVAESRPARHPAGLRQTLARLRKAKFMIEHLYGFRGPMSVFWAAMYYAAGYLGRQDWADRFHFRMRREYVVEGAGAMWTPVSVVSVYRPKSAVE